ncbi:Plasmid stabilization system protein ParE [Salegentibacter echinorum]|uniref:Plasmid stabilization system protein ParE n=1 Tax=Salegentibacter echinorum TaxID=1073325 RepID=A0A1M5LEQ1_SALEC|nr:type II toxin-antitoxin system RelE/ParE family toxin [Salegentibacter echinorum]SHG63478.1 Plasmid stabilization system protein ParE [Salegentibacter echinorum]
MRIVWRDKAKKELNSHIAYIAKRSPQNAQHVLNTLLELGDSLGNMPYKYPKEPLYNAENVRFVSKWHFKMIYRISEKEIQILRIFSMWQHPGKLKL